MAGVGNQQGQLLAGPQLRVGDGHATALEFGTGLQHYFRLSWEMNMKSQGYSNGRITMEAGAYRSILLLLGCWAGFLLGGHGSCPQLVARSSDGWYRGSWPVVPGWLLAGLAPSWISAGIWLAVKSPV